MGVQILWIMPIHPIGKIKRKGTLGSYYSISNFREVNPEFGTLDDFKNLVQQVHELDMKLILDWVANHAAWDNVWTQTNPDFFERDEKGNFKPPYDWDDVIQINHTNTDEQQAMIDAMAYWVKECDIDGFRADLAHLTPLPFWINARMQITALKKDLVWLAETEEVNYHEAFDISFAWKWMHDTEDYCKGKKGFHDLLNSLKFSNEALPSGAYQMYFTSNHDENSWNGTEYEKYNGFAKALTVFSCCWHGIPLVYTGQELPLQRRLKFFDKDTINWDTGTELHQFYKTLLALRLNTPAVFIEKVVPLFMPGAIEKNMLAFYRQNNEALLIVLINMGNNLQHYTIEDAGLQGPYTNVFTGNKVELHSNYTINLAAGEWVLLLR